MSLELSFELFYRQYYRQMVSYCFHTFQISEPDSEDIVEEAFTQLWQRWQELNNHSLPILIAWTRKTIQYMAYSYNRKKARSPVIVELSEWTTSEETQSNDASAYLIDEEILNEEIYQNYLSNIRSKLSRKQLRLFECIIINHNDIPTAARLLHMNENTVKVGLMRLRSKLKKEILPDLLK